MNTRLYPLRRFGVADFCSTYGHTQPAVHDHIVGSSWPQPSEVEGRPYTRRDLVLDRSFAVLFGLACGVGLAHLF